MKFVGEPVRFCYTDVKKIRHYIMEHFEFHKSPARVATYAFGVYVCPHYGGFCTVWVYVAQMTPLVETEEKARKGVDMGPMLVPGMPFRR
jgi:hypothetical protein